MAAPPVGDVGAGEQQAAGHGDRRLGLVARPVGDAQGHQGQGGPEQAAQARAAMNRSAEAKKSREEADTGEIPLVRIRKEAAEGHTTRQVLLTGPIPVVKETATADGDATYD